MLKIKTNLWEIRTKKHLIQKQLAELSDVSASHISFIEQEKRMPTVYVLIRLAKALDVKVDDLIVVKEDGFRSTYKYFRGDKE